ncbi:MAG TPA: hypothetical protein VKT53_09920 [Candidatus Acidoferrum sp.]|nr:hypothetical protein [Candidatus Acidoferrum sp.]
MQDALVGEHCTIDWWDMKPFPVARILQLVRAFSESMTDEDLAKPVANSMEEARGLAGNIQGIIDECSEWGFLLTADQFVRIQDEIKKNVKTSKVMPLVTDALNRLQDECKRVVVMHIEHKPSDYFSDPQFFDLKDGTSKKVSVEFPSAAEDIAEAGKCLACGRSTACVMHLGRVLEVGLKSLAATVGVSKQNDWGRYLEGIEKELANRVKVSGARTSDEQFYAEVHVTFDNLRRAWRNPTMHVDKIYTIERAEEILIAVRSFMRHLATRLKENP